LALITLLNASLAYGHVALLDHADFALESSQRIGLIGRNGTGKSSFLKILAGMEHADDGTMHVQQGVRIAYVAQEPLLEADDNIFESVQRGLAPVMKLIDDYSNCVGDLDDLQSQIEAHCPAAIANALHWRKLW
jgi:ATP-binding cassette subfamily F protein uup